MMRTLRDIGHLEGVKVLLRADFNVPIKNGTIVDDFRIVKSIPTIEYLVSRKAKVILISHIESSLDGDSTLEPIAKHLNDLNIATIFLKNIRNARTTIESELQNGSCLLLENLRTNEGEKNNGDKFAKELASLADIYVNDAFSVSHREHASIVGVPKHIPSYAGIQLEKEITELQKAFDPRHPFLLILGGAKFETKLPLLEKFSQTADMIFVGGALANDVFKAKGFPVGISKVSGETNIGNLISNPNVFIPIDVIVNDHVVRIPQDVKIDESILDAGPETISLLSEKISSAKFILWNGTLGLYEDGYTEGTIELAKLIAEARNSGAETIIGGGDTLAAISSLGLEEQFTFVSTGGGAMLDFLAKGTLPGIEVLNL